MSSSDPIPRRAVLLGGLALAGLAAGCGFTPAYGPGGAGTRLRGAIHLPDPSDADAFALNLRLSERLGPEADLRYDLAYTLRVAVVEQGITPEQVATRYALNGTADFRLTERATSAVVSQGQVSAFTSYSATGTTIATVAAESDARQRLMRMLADQLVTRLLGTVPAG